MKKIVIRFDKNLEKDLIEVVAKEDNPLVRNIENYINKNFPNSINCYKNNQLFRIPIDDIYRIYCENSFVYLNTEDQKFEIKERLYEIESKLNLFSFFKINKSELINMNKVKDFDFTYSGKVLVHLSNGDISTVSRRNINKLKEYLGVK